MGVTNSNKVADTAAICCGDQFKMTLALTAAPDIVTNPTDIVLALDCSGSMSGAPLADMKLGAKTFIDIISESTGGPGSPSRPPWRCWPRAPQKAPRGRPRPASPPRAWRPGPSPNC